ncbi:protein ZGRF1 isoform X1 [Meriones unguiculatus]|uniref:protein ZGRF1 isoform X1 n=1 Tax=Meriones unguiculatus TaxID=10047 RepID=UPI00293E4CC2|nr:protein ZGRF1 isoform X1 [Meriones unguiculatus]
MEIQEFIVLYTHQKMKKSKVWQDGILKIPHLGNKAILYDDKGACLESLFLKGLEVKPGDDLESERYLITVEEAKAAGSRAVKPGGPVEALETGPRTVTSSSRSLGCQPSGLKRKATGFQRPYKVPKTVTVTEHGKSAASLGDMKPGSTFPPSFSSTLPLFSTVGQKDINHTPAGSENIATFRNRERNNRPFSLVSSSLRINSDTQGKEDNFGFPVSSEAQHSDSLLAKEPMRRNSSDSHCPGVSQNLRSKAQILALLKSSSSNKSSDLHCEITGRFPNGWPQGCLEGTSKPKEKYAEMQSTGSLGCELQSENPTRTTSRWTMYLSSQRSPPCSARDENDTEDKPEAQKDVNIFNFSELLVPKKSELFETCTDNVELYSEDKPVDNNCQYRNQEENPAPSFYEKSSLLVSCNSKENVDLLPECDIQNSSKVPFSHNDQMCMEGSLCTGESVEGADAALEAEYRPVSPSPEMEQKQSETECSLSNNSKVSDDIVDMAAESYADRVSMNTLHNPLPPFLEVSFNLSNFETSDTDEASQEDSKLSQDSESWEKEILLTDDPCVQKSCGDMGCQEIAQKRLPLPPSASEEPKEMLPASKTLLSEFCDRTCVGFYAGPYEDADIGKTIEEQCGDTGSSLDSSLEWNEDAPGHSKEDANKSIQRNGINDGIISPSNNSRGTDTSLHVPYPLNTVTNPAPENSDLFSESTWSPPFMLGNHIDKNDEQVFLPVSNSGTDIQSLTTTQNHSEFCELDKSNTQVSSSLLYPVGTKHPVYKGREAYISESEELGRIRSVPCDLFEVETTQRNQQSCATSRNSSELSEVINNMSVLKSQSKHNTALGSLAILKKKHAFPQEVWCRGDPDDSPKARNSSAIVSRALLECPHEHRPSQQDINGSELCFPSGQKIISTYLPQRQVHIPAVFQSPTHYKQIFTASIIEHLNILLFELAQRLYKALSKVDISFYTSSKGESLNSGKNNLPSCHHNQPAKLVMVKKEGPNKGRLFYACDRPKGNQCKFFKWFEEATPGQLPQDESQPNMVFNDVKSIGSYLRSQKVPVYEECQLLLRKGFDFQRKQYGKLKKFATINPEFYSETKSKIYLKLSRKESSSVYSKDDLWVISKTLDFKLDTFIACSAFFGPSSVNEVELLPLKGYFPSNWPTNITVHALLVCNASTELSTLKNIQDYVNPATLPLMPYLLAMSQSTTVSSKNVSKRKFIPPAVANIKTKCELLDLGATLQLASEFISIHGLNKDQATALIQIAEMIASQEGDEDALEPLKHSLPITIIHGVFGAGKSYLLAVVILFFVQLFEKCDAETVGNARPWKLLISSSTNVAVDRVLLGLLSLGFEKFVRVGSVRKIAKPILPYSLHAGSENESEQLKELHALMREELTPIERVYVRKSIEQHKLGTNRILLKQVRVVGITCAACPFPCMNGLKFPVVVLDESSQMTEPASLLPIARFECEKLILVGDPKQLPPTIQGSDAAHENGLEQTLFNRLCLMGHKPILLRTQYRCHPVISAIANDLFYEGSLVNGVSEKERSPVLEWLPTLCFYNVAGAEQVQSENSFQNVAEAAFTLKLIQSLIASGVAGSMIGVITLYKSQMYKIFHLLSAVDVGLPDVKAVQVSTVDAFQGAEKEIIILSCVRTRQVGFIDSEKRMNVALTRGRRHLLIVGSLSCLRKNRLWGRVIQHCEGREDGLQHASQCEPQLDHLLKNYFEKQAEEKQKKKEKEKSKDKSH